MPFDGIFLNRMLSEIAPKLEDGRVEKIHQPEKDEIILTLRASGQSLRLLLSAHPTMCRLHLSTHKQENPTTPPNFCMMLRKHLQNARLKNLVTDRFERIVRFDFETYNELNDRVYKHLIIEIMGKHSNIILLNENYIILDAIKHIDFSVNRIREVLPARPYIAPPFTEKQNPQTVHATDLFLKITQHPIHPLQTENPDHEALMNDKPLRIDQFLVNQLMGFSPFLAKQLCIACDIPPHTLCTTLSPKQIEQLTHSLTHFQLQLTAQRNDPILLYKPDAPTKPLDFYCFSFGHFKHSKTFSTLSEATETFFAQKNEANRMQQRKSELEKHISSAKERLEKKIDIHRSNQAATENLEHLKQYGDLLLTYLPKIQMGDATISLENYYLNPIQTENIPINDEFSAQENARAYYEKYQKSKKIQQNAIQQLAIATEELHYIDQLLFSLDNVSTNKELDDIFDEWSFMEHPTKRNLPKFGQRKPVQTTGYYTYRISDGSIVLVGKNNTQNDLLTFKVATAKDIWLHTKDIPGSHVILKIKNQAPSTKTIQEAAILAAYHSKAKLSANVPVDFTAVKYVKKRNKAKPGMVIYTHQNTVFVTPDKDFVEQCQQPNTP